MTLPFLCTLLLWSCVSNVCSGFQVLSYPTTRPTRITSGRRRRRQLLVVAVAPRRQLSSLPAAAADADDASDSDEWKAEEPLSAIFQRAVVLQRAGSQDAAAAALEEYNLFLKAARQFPQVSPFMYAEVYGNMGALYLRQKRYEAAREHLQQALDYRAKFGTVHVNLAVVALQQLQQQQASLDTTNVQPIGKLLIESAKKHCQAALDCNTDPRSVAMAQRLLEDIEKMTSSPMGL